MHLVVFLIISYWLFPSSLQFSFFFFCNMQMFLSKRENMIPVLLKYINDAGFVFFPSELLPPAAESVVKEHLTAIP